MTYGSRASRQHRKAMRWLSSAKAVVFVGTSFAVNVTCEALEAATRRRLPTFNFNTLAHEDALRAQGAAKLRVTHVLGDCVRTLPALAQEVARLEGDAAAGGQGGGGKRPRAAEAAAAAAACVM